MLIVYENTTEVIICTPESESEVLKTFFQTGNPQSDLSLRSLKDYDRVELKTGITAVSVELKASRR
jgi:hypothetical protein